MMTASGERITIPRNFKLLEELEKSEKAKGDMTISFGLVEPDDIFMTDWVCSLMGPNGTAHDNRFYEVRVHCAESYPDQPPEVWFSNKINMGCVDPSGKVVPAKVPVMANWTRNSGIEQVLVALRQEMQSHVNRRLPQPPEGTRY